MRELEETLISLETVIEHPCTIGSPLLDALDAEKKPNKYKYNSIRQNIGIKSYKADQRELGAES